MPYVQHTPEDMDVMLRAAGVSSSDELFASIPADIRAPDALDLPSALTEPELLVRAGQLAARNWPAGGRLFLGAGCYRHFVPPVVDQLISRGEFLTAYTPYQPELAQGTLQVIFEFQTLICALTGMQVSNASMYDGATACAEAILLCLKTRRGKAGRVILSAGVHPHTRAVVRTYLANLGTPVEIAPLAENGGADLDALSKSAAGGDALAVVYQTPNFLGVLEDGRAIIDAAHDAGAMAVAQVNPVALGVIQPPGDEGADVVAGDGGMFGNAPSSGGPGFGFLATRDEHKRAMPGRIVGLTRDRGGRPAFCLALQTREQHIRREKATSNICTNQQVCATRGAMHMLLLGKSGIARLAELNLQRAHWFAERIADMPGFSLRSDAPFFNEFVVRAPVSAADVLRSLKDWSGIVGGLDLSRYMPEMTNHLLVCATEENTRDEMDLYLRALRRVGSARAAADNDKAEHP